MSTKKPAMGIGLTAWTSFRESEMPQENAKPYTADDVIEHEIPATQDIRVAVDNMRALTMFTGKPVMAMFNGRVLLAEPGDSYDDVIRAWDHEQQASYFGEVRFPR